MAEIGKLTQELLRVVTDGSDGAETITSAEIERLKASFPDIPAPLVDRVVEMINIHDEGALFSADDVTHLQNEYPDFADKIFTALRSNPTSGISLPLFSSSALSYLDQIGVARTPVGIDVPDTLNTSAEIQAKRKVFLQYIAYMKELGFEPTLVLTAYFETQLNNSSPQFNQFMSALRTPVFAGDIFLHDSKQFFTQNRLPFVQDGSQSLDVIAENAYRPVVEIDARLLNYPEGHPCNMSSIMVYCLVEGETCHIVIWDWFQDKPFFSKDYSLSSKDADYYKRASEEIYGALKDYLTHFDFKAEAQAVPPLTSEERQVFLDNQVYSVRNPTGWNAGQVRESQQSWRKLTRDFEMKIETRPLTADVDRDHGKNFLLYPTATLTLTEDQLKEIGFGPLEVKGLTDVIELIPNSARGQKRDGREIKNSFQGQHYIDRYGNLIVPIMGEIHRSGKPVLMEILVVPGYRLLKDSNQPLTQQPTGIDLTPLGLENYPNLLSVTAVPPVKTATEEMPYSLYSTMPSSDGTQIQGRDAIFEHVGVVAKQVETYFGFKPGERIHNIFFLPSLNENASAKQSNPDTFFIWDEIMPFIQSGDGDFIVAHEMYHALDFQFGFSEQPGFVALFDRLKSAEDNELFEAINEKSFRNLPMGGHADDNVYEFFASLVNTLDAPTWQESVANMSDRVRGLYYQALVALQSSFETCNPAMKNSPIFLKLQERLASLEQMGTYPPLEELALLPVSKILASEPNPVRIIDAWSFKKEVLQSKKPVVLYLFNEDERHSVNYVKELSLQLEEGVELMAIPYDQVTNYLFTINGIFGNSVHSNSLCIFDQGKMIYYSDGGLFDPEEREVIFTAIVGAYGKPQVSE